MKINLRILWRDFLIGCKNLIKWFPIIWKNKDWDSHYTFDVLQFQLIQQRNYIEKNKRFVGWEYVVRDINICLKLIERVKEGYYALEFGDYQKTIVEFTPIENTGRRELKIENTEENYEEFFRKYPRIYRKYFGPNKTDNLIAIRISSENHRRAKKLLFSILEEKIERWWD